MIDSLAVELVARFWSWENPVTSFGSLVGVPLSAKVPLQSRVHKRVEMRKLYNHLHIIFVLISSMDRPLWSSFMKGMRPNPKLWS